MLNDPPPKNGVGPPEDEIRLAELDDGGCTIAIDVRQDDASLFLFIAYSDVRGVGRVSWDPQKIGK